MRSIKEREACRRPPSQMGLSRVPVIQQTLEAGILLTLLLSAAHLLAKHPEHLLQALHRSVLVHAHVLRQFVSHAALAQISSGGRLTLAHGTQELVQVETTLLLNSSRAGLLGASQQGRQELAHGKSDDGLGHRTAQPQSISQGIGNGSQECIANATAAAAASAQDGVQDAAQGTLLLSSALRGATAQDAADQIAQRILLGLRLLWCGLLSTTAQNGANQILHRCP